MEEIISGMIENFNNRKELTVAIVLPVHLLIIKILLTTKNYFQHKTKFVIGIFLSIGILGKLVFDYRGYISEFSEAWIINFTFPTVIYYFTIVRSLQEDIYENKIFKITKLILEAIIGMIVIIIQFTSLPILFGGIDSRIDIISKGIFILLGISYIFLNKMTINIFLKRDLYKY